MVSKAIWKRRVVLMAVVGLLVAIPATLLLRGGGGEDTEVMPVSAPTEGQPKLADEHGDRGLDVAYRVPKGWSERKQASAVRLRSPERSVEIVVAAPAPAGRAKQVLEQALDAIRSGYERVEVSSGSGREVGGLRAKGAIVAAEAKGVQLQIAVAVARGERRAYLVEVFTTAGIEPRRLREAQAALNSLELEG